MSSRDEYVEIMKQAFVTLGKKVIAQAAIDLFPFLATSFGSKVLMPFVSLGAGVAVEALVTKAETAAFFLFIDARTGQQGKDFEAAAYANYKIQQNGEPWEKANAEKVLRTTFAKLVSFKS